ncbi:MAG: hypothetical protein ACLFRU_11470 [Paracoccaceae bacterium]
MQVILHTGAHCTDEDRLVKCLVRNIETFRKLGVAVPGPGRYRKLLRDTLTSMRRAAPSEGAREVLLDAILDEDPDQVDRILLSNENFFAAPRLALQGGVLYPLAEERLTYMQELFAPDRLELFMALRNPATFLPALFSTSSLESLDELLQGADPLALRWSDLIERIRAALPELPITLWCNEDTPLIWGQILREMAGLEPNRKISGAFDILAEIMSAEGMQRFRAYLRDHPDLTEMQKRRVMAAFLEKFALEEKVEEELDVPGWTEETIDALTDLYEEDVERIGRIPGVTLIAP